MPKCTDLPTNWHSFLPTFHLSPVCDELQNTKTNSEHLLADYLQNLQTPGILGHHFVHIQALQPF